MSSSQVKVEVEVEGSLHFEEDSSDSEDDEVEEGERGGEDEDDAPLVFGDGGDSEEEELEVFRPQGVAEQSLAPVATKTSLVKSAPPVKEVKEKASPLSLLSAMANAVQAIEQENEFPSTEVTETEEDVEFSRLDAALQRETALKKNQVDMKSGNETFDCSSRSNPVQTSDTDNTDTFGIAYKPFMKKKNSYELPKGPAFEDEVEFERELLSSSTVAAPTLSAVGTGQQQDPVDEDDEFDFEEVAPGSIRAPVVLPKFVPDEPESVESKEDSGPPSETVQSSSKISNDSIVEKEDDFRESARKALAEIKDVYSSGLGDHEIVLLKAQEDIEKNGTVSSDAIMLDMSKGAAIEEIDEEELERQEEEEAQREQDQATSEMQSRATLQSQWDSVDIKCEEVGGEAGGDTDETFTAVKYVQVEAYFRNMDLSHFRDKIVIDSEDSSTWSLLSKSSKLSKASISREAIELPFLIAQVDYNPTEFPEHLNFLRNIYKTMVRSMPVLPPPVGGHWEAIGFQGLDPSTDLNRSMKMLTIVQVFHMIEKERSISQSLYDNSLGVSGVLQDSSNGKKPVDTSWPFMCVAIGMTKNSIDALRSGVLTKYAIRYKSALEALHEYHHACFYCFLRSLVANPHMHHAEHLNAIRKEVSSNPLGLLRAFRKSKDANNEMEKARLKKKSDDGRDSETTSMYDVSTEKGDAGIDGSEDNSSSKRGSWKNIFSSKKDDRAKQFMA